jgi:hypothetical protein
MSNGTQKVVSTQAHNMEQQMALADASILLHLIQRFRGNTLNSSLSHRARIAARSKMAEREIENCIRYVMADSELAVPLGPARRRRLSV